MEQEYSLQSEKYYKEHLQMSSSPLKKLMDQHSKTLQDDTLNKTANATYRPAQELNLGEQQAQDEYCCPKFLSWLGKICTPCKIFCPCCFCSCCYCAHSPIFQQQVKSVGLLQEWGQYKRTLQPGLHIINPVSQSILEINQQTRILQYAQICISKDNVQFEVKVVLFYRVVDSLKVAYRMGISHLQAGVKEIAVGLLRSVVGQNTLQTTIQNRNMVSNKFTAQMNTMMDYWGVFVEVASLKELKLSPEITHALQAVAETKRSSEAMLINYRGQVSCAALYKEISQIIDTKAAYQIRFLNMVEQVLSRGTENVVFLRTRLPEKVGEGEEERERLGGR